MFITIENADKKLLDVIKYVIKIKETLKLRVQMEKF